MQIGAQTQAEITIGDQKIEKYKSTELDYDNIDGTPYLEKEFLNGFIIFTSNSTSDTMELQYDVFSKEFFIIDTSDKEAVIHLKFVKEIHMDGKEESYLFKRINPSRPHKFYEVIYESDDFDIYNDMKATYHHSTDNGIVQTREKFTKKDNYYLLRKGEKAKKIKLKKKDIYKQLSSEKKSQADQLLKEHKLKLKKSRDFKRLFELLNN